MDLNERFLAVIQTHEGLILLENGTEIFKTSDSDHKKSSHLLETQHCQPKQLRRLENGNGWLLNLSEFDLATSRQVLFKRASPFSEWLGAPLVNSLANPLAELDVRFDTLQKTSFFKVAESAITEMNDSILKKIVPCVFESGHTKIDFRSFALNLLKRLQKAACDQAYLNSYPYAFIDFEQEFAFLGITPELLFSQNSRSLNTMALAGTYFEDKGMTREAFLVDPKETYEHKIVVADIKERLQPLGEIFQDSLTLKSVGALEHLMTKLQVELSQEADYALCVNTLHPTAALGVYPKTMLSEWRERLSCGQTRRFFGGPFGVETPDGQSFCYVAIRNIEIDQNQIRIGSGCGIVSKSDLEKEWQELTAKRNAVKRIFSL